MPVNLMEQNWTGNGKLGSTYGAVVSSVPLFEGQQYDEHYGGYLVCETCGPSIRPLVAAAPKLLRELDHVVRQAEAYPSLPIGRLVNEFRPDIKRVLLEALGPPPDDEPATQPMEWPIMTEVHREYLARVVLNFKQKLAREAEDAINNLYVDVLPHLESDTFYNWKQQAMSSVRRYATKEALTKGSFDGMEIREAIFRSYRDELVGLLNQDLLKQVEDLKKMVEFEREMRR